MNDEVPVLGAEYVADCLRRGTPLASIRAAIAELGGDENNAADVGAGMALLAAKRAASGNVIIVEEDSAPAGPRLRGTSAIFANADVVITTAGRFLKCKRAESEPVTDQTIDDVADPKERGDALWVSSEEDGHPDCGVYVALGGGAMLCFGEISKADWEDAGGAEMELGDDFGWWLILHAGGKKTVLAKCVDYLEITEAVHTIIAALKGPAA